MKKIITILTLLCSFGLKAGAQQFLSREAYRDKVEAYSQVLKQQHRSAKNSKYRLPATNRHHSRRYRQPQPPG